MFTEQIILVGMISTLASLTVALGAALLAIISVSIDKRLSSFGFWIFLAFAFGISVTIWSFEVFITIPDNQWLHVAGLGAMILACSLYLVPRLRDVYRSTGIMGN